MRIRRDLISKTSLPQPSEATSFQLKTEKNKNKKKQKKKHTHILFIIFLTSFFYQLKVIRHFYPKNSNELYFVSGCYFGEEL